MPRRTLPFSPWWLVVAAAIAMGSAGLYQFTWSSLRGPIGALFGASETSLGTVFTLFIVFQTVSQVPIGWVRDRYGPRWPLVGGGLCLAGGFALSAVASGVTAVYLAYCFGGVGAGTTYTVGINTAIKWFDARRGLATGLISSMYGAVSFLAIPLIREAVQTDVRGTLLGLSVVAGVGVFVAVPVLRDPSRADDGSDSEERTVEPTVRRDYDWRATLRTWQFWLMYGVFVLASGVSLMVVGKAVSFATQFGFSAATATGSASLIALADATGIFVSGTLSDRFGRETTSAVSLVCSGLALAGAVLAAEAGVGIAVIAALAAMVFLRSPVFSVFPPLVGDYFGPRRSSTNFALLYSAKLWSGVGGGIVASSLIGSVGWSATFLGGAALVVLAGLATFFLRPTEPNVADGPNRHTEGEL
ncbi:OFA family MFS transporter [Haloarcula laminariae]|uniref:OFA family MFS transporter n=1 Tax=Haloarcula laminariae TaxID=2961577 RepID=UPI0021C6035F|nr:OFA family MFS transporter [Halomicroarcula laminariae]